MVDPPRQPADLSGADRGSAESVTPLLVVRKNARHNVWPWVWLGFLLLGLVVLAWLIYQVSRIYSLGQATLVPDRPLLAENITEDTTDDSTDNTADAPPANPAPAGAGPATETPPSDTPPSESPDTETPVTETPDTESPDTGTPASEPPASEPPASEAPASEAPAGATPTGEVPAGETLDGDTLSGVRPPDEAAELNPADASPPPPFTASRDDDGRVREDVRRVVEQVRWALAKQDLMGAERQLTALRQLSLSPAETLLAERLRSARFHLQRFWRGVERGRQQLRIGDRLTVGRSQPEQIVQLDTSSVRLKSDDGTERTLPFGLHTYDPHLVAAVARRDLQTQGAPFLLALATFWASDRTGDPRQARVLFQAAEQQGLAVGSLSREAAWVTSAEPPATDGRRPIPPRRALTEARQQVKTTYGSRFAQLDSAGQLQLAQEMLDAAAAADQPEALRYALLEQVVKIGCHIGSVDKAFAAVDALVDRFAVPVTPITYAQTWERAYAKISDDNGRRAAISQAVRMAESLLARQQPTVAQALIETAQAKLLTVPDDGLLVQLNQLRQQAKASQAKTKTPPKPKP